MIDIVIPVYNTPNKDLIRCLESIKNQSYTNYQVYIIDDGSKKETATILDEYSSNNPQFHTIHIPNGGVSHARNIGLQYSQSEYITFVDSDDEVEPNFLKESLELLENNHLDMIVGGYQEIKDNEVRRTRLCEPGLHIYEGKETEKFFDKLLSGKLCKDNQEIQDAPTGRIYTRLYRKSCIQGITFNENVKISEDTLFVIDLMKNLNRIGVVDKIWYKYYQNPYSIVHKEFGSQELKNLLVFMNEIYQRMLLEKRSRIKNAYKMRIFKTCVDIEEKLIKVDPNIFQNEILTNSFKDIDLSSYINIKPKEIEFKKRI